MLKLLMYVVVVPLAASMNSIFFKGEYDEIGIERKESMRSAIKNFL